MLINVWKTGIFSGKVRQVDMALCMFILDGQAFASWGTTPASLNRNQLLRVSDELASQVLGASRGPCSYVGHQPKYSMVGANGYTCRDKTIGEDCYTIEHCSECGHHDFYPGNPRFRAVCDGRYSIEGHPQTTRLMSEVDIADFSHAEWDDAHQTLTPSNQGGVIHVTVARGLGSWRQPPRVDVDT